MAPWKRLSAGALFFAVLLVTFVPPSVAHGRTLPPAEIWRLVDLYAARYGIPQYIARNLVRVESGGRQHAVSRKGARGVMQLMPRTARALRVNINDPEQNIEGGMRYLRRLHNRFGRWDLALGAYHSGPAAVVRHRGVPPKSRRYVRLVLDNTRMLSASRGAAPRRIGAKERLAEGFVWPLDGAISARFDRGHTGIDLAAVQGTPIRAARAGTVVHAGWYYDYGRTVILDHGGGVTSLYGHTSSTMVETGQVVDAGQVIARVGCSGRCTGPHVHFEIRVAGRAVNPQEPGALAAAPAPAVKPPAPPSPPAAANDGKKPGAADAPAGSTALGSGRQAVTTVVETLQDGQVVARVETTVVVLEDDLRLRVIREFRRVNGVLTLVREHTEVFRLGVDEDEDDEDD